MTARPVCFVRPAMDSISPGALCGASGAGETIASNNCGRALEAQLWRFLGKDAHDRVSHGGGVLR
jgi:DNA helicase HerA-like ATPase